MARRVHFLYRWASGRLTRVGAVSEARLRAWEYDVASREAWPATSDGAEDTVRLWKTRRPDLAPPELWVGDTESASVD